MRTKLLWCREKEGKKEGNDEGGKRKNKLDAAANAAAMEVNGFVAVPLGWGLVLSFETQIWAPSTNATVDTSKRESKMTCSAFTIDKLWRVSAASCCVWMCGCFFNSNSPIAGHSEWCGWSQLLFTSPPSTRANLSLLLFMKGGTHPVKPSQLGYDATL